MMVYSTAATHSKRIDAMVPFSHIASSFLPALLAAIAADYIASLAYYRSARYFGRFFERKDSFHTDD